MPSTNIPKRKKTSKAPDAELVLPKPVDLKPKGMSVQRVEDQVKLSEISQSFDKGLQDLDHDRGWSLTNVWRSCVQMHDDNAVLRQNFQQLQVVLQQTYQEWMQSRKTIGDYVDSLDIKEEDFEERYHAILKINQESTKLITHVTTAIKQLKQEMRQTEFQSKFFCHVNLVQQFLAGVTGILHKHLQSNEKLDDIIKDIRRLSEIFRLQEQGIGGHGMDQEDDS